MGKVKNYFWEEIMSNQENEKFDELVNEQKEELEFQERLQSGLYKCQFCKKDFSDEPEKIEDHQGEPACDDCTYEPDDMMGGIHPDTESLEDFQPNEYFTEGGDQ